MSESFKQDMASFKAAQEAYFAIRSTREPLKYGAPILDAFFEYGAPSKGQTPNPKPSEPCADVSHPWGTDQRRCAACSLVWDKTEDRPPCPRKKVL